MVSASACVIAELWGRQCVFHECALLGGVDVFVSQFCIQFHGIGSSVERHQNYTLLRVQQERTLPALRRRCSQLHNSPPSSHFFLHFRSTLERY